MKDAADTQGTSVVNGRALRRGVGGLLAVVVVVGLPLAPVSAVVPYGTTSLAIAEHTLVGPTPGAQAGLLVGPVGDLDGDGYDETVAGAWFDDTNGERAGKAYLVYGPPPDGVSSLADADAILLGARPFDGVGAGWAGVGDVDGDGYDDLAIGAPGDTAPGVMHLLYGGPERLSGTMDLEEASDARFTLVGASEPDYAAWDMASAVDLDADGVHDLAIGASRDGEGGESAGAAYVFYGGQRWEGTVDLADADVKLLGDPGEWAAGRLDGLGDVDGDDVEDLIVGAPSGAADPLPAVYVLYGERQRWNGTVRLREVAARLEVPEFEWNFSTAGQSFAGAADLDADGYDDFALGDGLSDIGPEDSGTTYVVYGGPERLTGSMKFGDAADALIVGEAVRDRSGVDLGIIERFDGDVFADLVIGAPRNDEGGEMAGAAYVFTGQRRRFEGTLSVAQARTQLVGWAPFAHAGSGVGKAGDVDGDGRQDLVVNALFHDDGAGAIHILTGDVRSCVTCRHDRGVRRPTPRRDPTGG